jgi:DNA polymerase III delta' subunit
VLRWSDLDGHAASQLRSAVTATRLSHAYLFSGGSVGPQLAAAAVLARAVNCLRSRPGEDDPCGACDACYKIDQGIHPDVVTLPREGAAQMISIDTVRGQVIARLALPPHEAAVRVFIVEEAAALAGPAANALLKTLEEPPRRTLFLLCTVAPDGLLPTIRSRCQRVRFAGDGSVAIAPGAAGDEGDDEAAARRAHLGALAEELSQPPHAPDLIARICEGKGDAPQVVDLALRALHRQATGHARAGELPAARAAAQRVAALLDVHRGMTVHNAQPQLALEALLIGWRIG